MSLIDKIENIQKKPDYIKKRILFTIMAVIMFVIIAAWALTLNITLGGGESGHSYSQLNESVAAPFTVIKDIAVDSFQNLFSSF